MKLPIETIINLSDLMNSIDSYEGLSDEGAIAIYENASEYEKLVKNEYLDKIQGFIKKLKTDELAELEEKAKSSEEDKLKLDEAQQDIQNKFDTYRNSLVSEEFEINIRTISKEDHMSIVKNPNNRKKLTRYGFRLIEELFVTKPEVTSDEVLETEK